MGVNVEIWTKCTAPQHLAQCTQTGAKIFSCRFSLSFTQTFPNIFLPPDQLTNFKCILSCWVFKRRLTSPHIRPKCVVTMWLLSRPAATVWEAVVPGLTRERVSSSSPCVSTTAPPSLIPTHKTKPGRALLLSGESCTYIHHPLDMLAYSLRVRFGRYSRGPVHYYWWFWRC